MNNKLLKIAFATPNYNVWDIRRGSGSYYSLCKELALRGHSLLAIGPVDYHPPIFTRLQKRASNALGKRYRSWQDVFSARAIGTAVRNQLANSDYDFLLTNDYSIAAFAQIKAPVVLYSDSVFPRHYSENAHPWLSNLPWFNIISCQYVTKRSLQQVKLCCLPTTWARTELSKYPTFDKNKTKVIPFGSNLPSPAPSVAQERMTAKFSEKQCLKMLFVGKDWELKGGKIALGVADALNEKGIKTLIHIVGSMPPNRKVRDHVKLHGLLNKDIPSEQAKLVELFCESDVFILPSKAEGFGIVFAEAASFGLPSLAFDTTGVSTAVKNGQSGVLIPLDSPDPVSCFVSIIESWWKKPEDYNAFVKGARKYFEETVNWETAVSKLLYEIEQIL